MASVSPPLPCACPSLVTSLHGHCWPVWERRDPVALPFVRGESGPDRTRSYSLRSAWTHSPSFLRKSRVTSAVTGHVRPLGRPGSSACKPSPTGSSLTASRNRTDQPILSFSCARRSAQLHFEVGQTPAAARCLPGTEERRGHCRLTERTLQSDLTLGASR